MAMKGDPVKALTIFTGACAACHDENGQGNERALALSDPIRLVQFDDAWYVETISAGGPAKACPLGAPNYHPFRSVTWSACCPPGNAERR
ncbi:MAG: hypothetical protein BroJett011_13480 [Chloroflexota bacterium]|nr:MAG: hypothetical protein BroJett011_13480 [Chloroflexota bacterium]